jgi:hypothetical protein
MVLYDDVISRNDAIDAIARDVRLYAKKKKLENG